MLAPTALRKTITSLTLGLVAGLALPASSHATDGYVPACTYVWVTRYVEREVPVTKYVTRYDHCGRPYKVARICYETVRVPVRVRVPACD